MDLKEICERLKECGLADKDRIKLLGDPETFGLKSVGCSILLSDDFNIQELELAIRKCFVGMPVIIKRIYFATIAITPVHV